MSKNNLTYVELNPKCCSDLLLKDCATNTYKRIDAPFLLESDSKALAESFRALFASVAIDRKRGVWIHELLMAERGSKPQGDYDFVVTDEFALSFYNTYKILSDSTRGVYKNGLETGKSLLLGLNNGDITMNDFDKNIKK